MSADFAPEASNLELSVYPGDFVPGQRALAEATTDNRPEILIIDDVQPGSFVLKVDQFRPLGAAVQSLTYDLKIELSDYGFCSDDDECDPGFVCGEGVCIEDPDPCAGRCTPLEVCDAETAECIERCEPDRFEGLNSARESAQFIATGRVDDLTICDGESDWYRLPIQEPTKLVVEVNGLGDPANNDVQLELWSIDQNLVQENEDPPPEPFGSVCNQLNEKVEYRFERRRR